MKSEKLCPKCKNITYRLDGTCVKCLIHEAKQFIAKIDKDLERFRLDMSGKTAQVNKNDSSEAL
jgi:hypothetical protein